MDRDVDVVVAPCILKVITNISQLPLELAVRVAFTAVVAATTLLSIRQRKLALVVLAPFVYVAPVVNVSTLSTVPNPITISSA